MLVFVVIVAVGGGSGGGGGINGPAVMSNVK